MFERLDQIEARYEELTQALASPEHHERLDEIPEDRQGAQRNRAHGREVPRVQGSDSAGIAESKAMLADETDADMRAYAEEELAKLEARAAASRAS